MKELLHRYSWLRERMIAERLGGLDEALVSRDRRAILEKTDSDLLKVKVRSTGYHRCSLRRRRPPPLSSYFALRHHAPLPK